MQLLTEGQVLRVGRVVRQVEGMRAGGDVRLPRGGPALPVRVAVLKQALSSGGSAQGVLMAWDEQSQTLFEETNDPQQYVTIYDRLDDGTNPGIVGESGRRCIVAADVSGHGWMIVQTLFTCS